MKRGCGEADLEISLLGTRREREGDRGKEREEEREGESEGDRERERHGFVPATSH